MPEKTMIRYTTTLLSFLRVCSFYVHEYGLMRICFRRFHLPCFEHYTVSLLNPETEGGINN